MGQENVASWWDVCWSIMIIVNLLLLGLSVSPHSSNNKKQVYSTVSILFIKLSFFGTIIWGMIILISLTCHHYHTCTPTVLCVCVCVRCSCVLPSDKEGVNFRRKSTKRYWKSVNFWSVLPVTQSNQYSPRKSWWAADTLGCTSGFICSIVVPSPA